jgi:hypothetical protein
MRQQRHAGSGGSGREAPDRSGHLGGPALDPVHHRDELLARQAGALDHRREFVPAVTGRDRHMIVEGDYVDPARRQPGDDFGLGIEIVGLVPKVEPRVGAELGPQVLETVQDRARVFSSAQTRLP